MRVQNATLLILLGWYVISCTSSFLSPSTLPVLNPGLRKQHEHQQQVGLLSPSSSPPPPEGRNVDMDDEGRTNLKPAREEEEGEMWEDGDELPLGDREWFSEVKRNYEELLVLQQKTRAKFERGLQDNASNQGRVSRIIAHIDAHGERADLLPLLRSLKCVLEQQEGCLERVLESERRSGETAREILLALTRSEAKTLSLEQVSDYGDDAGPDASMANS